ncbi:S-crystallin SL11-like isoform X1 [Physella acuta]|uniref:S-crystallin SL11-like isoform X1 n=1 Tax=Physella acuta TaxID=109671 RepID=UPI0027DAC32B|nr:S-crystallin SL11-like isoform X1 [Physella acuta]XP_059150768.1 S-crystallin SL11-like isoform X1 [Physella acuta]
MAAIFQYFPFKYFFWSKRDASTQVPCPPAVRPVPSYKLIYFNGRGRAELCRLLFVLAGQDFDDVRIQDTDWPAFKATTPFGQLPILEVNGKIFTQSLALATYLAREFGYHGNNNLESLAIEQVVCLTQDLVNKALLVFHELDPGRKNELRNNFLNAIVPEYLKHFQKLLRESGTGYFVGDQMTLADLVVWNSITSFENRLKVTGLVDNCTEVKDLFARVSSSQRIADYVARRKPTEF